MRTAKHIFMHFNLWLFGEVTRGCQGRVVGEDTVQRRGRHVARHGRERHDMVVLTSLLLLRTQPPSVGAGAAEATVSGDMVDMSRDMDVQIVGRRIWPLG